jgi:transposase
MNHHKRAALTIRQREEVARLYREGVKIAVLARQFGVTERTARKWALAPDPTDRSSAPHQHGRVVVTDEYTQAVLVIRRENPHFGPRRIAEALRPTYPTANSATVWRILHKAGQSRTRPPKVVLASP